MLIEKKLFCPKRRRKKTRQQERKTNRIVTLVAEMTRRSNYNLNPRKLCQTKSLPKPQSGSKRNTY